MAIQRKIWIAVALLASLAGGYWGLEHHLHRFVRSDRDLLSLLPDREATCFFADLQMLRSTGYLRLFESVKRNPEADYSTFVRETGFDYTKHLDALAGLSDGREFLFALRGRFDWSKLRRYAEAHGGDCPGAVCKVPTSKPGRWASFRSIQPDVMALAVGADTAAAEFIRPSGRVVPWLSDAPVWIRPSRGLLEKPAELPVAIRIFAISLQSSDSVVLSLRPSARHGAAFELQLDAHFANSPTAETASKQLEIDTKMLKIALAREGQPIGAADLTGLLTSGSFEVVHSRVIGAWPVPRDLLASLQ